MDGQQHNQKYASNIYIQPVDAKTWRGHIAATMNQSDCHLHIQNIKGGQSSYLNSDHHMNFEGCSPMNISSKHSPLTHAGKSDKRGRNLDDAWGHAKPLDELRQKAECRYCGFVSSHGGISRLKAHLGGGIPGIHLPGCDKVSPEVKKVMAEWFNEWVKNTKAVWAKGIQDLAESAVHDERRMETAIAWEHAKPLDGAAGEQQTESKYFPFMSSDGRISQHQLHLGVKDPKLHADTWPNLSPEIKGERGENSDAFRACGANEGMSEGVNTSTTSKTKKAADPQVERRGRPLDEGWLHAKQLDVARQKTQCNYCGFISSYGGVSRLKAHLGGGCPQMQLQGCPRVSPEVKSRMNQWFTEWEKTSMAAWIRKPNGSVAKYPKKGRPLDDAWEHAIPLDELKQVTRCKYCGFVSKCGGIERLKIHLLGGDPVLQLEGCDNVPLEVRNLMLGRKQKPLKKSKGMASMATVGGVHQGLTVALPFV